MKKSVYVVAAIIENDNSEILCALRSKKMALPLLWEFPGGKVDANESEPQALRREIEEELLCKIDVGGFFHEVWHEYDGFNLRMVAYSCKLKSGTPTVTEHAKLTWLKREYLRSLVWAPADIPIVDKLIKESQADVSSS